MSSDDTAYYRARAATERTRAIEAPTDEIAAVHHKLADLYEALTARMDQAASAQDLQPLTEDNRQTH